MIDRQMKNDKGFTLIEMLIAMAISVVLLGAAIYTYSKQDQVLREENRSLQTRDFARMAMDRVIDNLLHAGYGMPPGDSNVGRPAFGFTNADVTTLTYRANIDSVSTNVNQDSTNTTNNWLWVVDTTDFTVGDTLVFFDVETPISWNTKTLVGKNASTLIWTTGAPGRNDFDFQPIDNDAAVTVSQFHTITFTYNSGPQTITITDDGGNTGVATTTTTVASKVSGLTFSYFDEAGAALTVLTSTDPADPTELGEIRKIGISITTVNDDDTSITATLLTDINLRNMGI
jgi:prepilin-type N-terminal cleavage/methylation domain-containing protein